MKKILGWLTSNVLLVFMYFVFAIAMIMLILYFATFNGWFNDIFIKWGFYKVSTEWSNFGSYFASITGLLAFAGVLYTAWQSEQRAKIAEQRAEDAEQKAKLKEQNAKEESIKREERDLFFKLLELHQENLKSVIFNDGQTDHIGIKAFEDYANILNKVLAEYMTYFYITRLSKTCFDEDSPTLNLTILQVYGDICKEFHPRVTPSQYKLYFDEVVEYIKILMNDGNFYNKKYINLSVFDIVDHYERLFPQNKQCARYFALKFAGNIVSEKYGPMLDQYIRNMYYVLLTCEKFQYNNEDYLKLFRAQLSRNELLVCLFITISDRSSTKFVEMLSKYKILDNISYKDILLIKDKSIYNGQAFEFVKMILNCYLEEHKESGSH